MAPSRISVPPPVLVRSAVPEIWPFTVSWPTSTRRVLEALRMIGAAERVGAGQALQRAAVEGEGSLTMRPPWSCSVAPVPTSVPRRSRSRPPRRGRAVPAVAVGFGRPFESDAFAVVVGVSWLLRCRGPSCSGC